MAFPSMLVWAMSSPAMAYVYYGVMKLPRGRMRLIAALPLIACYAYAAKGFETVFERSVYSFFFIWLTSFKIVLLCWDDGPAADPWAVASFPRFLAVMNLSLQIKRQKFGDRYKKKKQLATHRMTTPEVADSISGRTNCVLGARDKESSAATRRTNGHGSDINTRVNGHAAKTSNSEAQVAESSSSSSSSSSSDSRFKQGRIALLKWVDESQEMPMVVFRLLLKFVCVMVMTYCFTYRASMPVGLLCLLYSFYIYVTCSLIFEGIAAVVAPLMGIELEPFFNKPFLAHSLANFWGQRWNLLVSNLLRVSIYDPMLRFLLGSEGLGSSAPHPSKSLGLASGTPSGSHTPSEGTTSAPSYARVPLWARSVSTFSCFLVSGLMHELIFHNMTRSKPSGEVTIFFILNGGAALLEGALRRKTSLRLPKYVSTPLTLAFILITAIWFFYPPLVDSGTADHAIAEFQYFFFPLYHVVGAS